MAQDKTSVCSEYAVSRALARRLNFDGSLPLAYPITLTVSADLGNGETDTVVCPAGIFGKSGTFNMSSFVTDTEIKLKFIERGKTDTVTIPCVTGDFVSETAATVAELVTLLSKATTGITTAGNFPNIGHAFTPSADGATGRLKIIGASGSEVTAPTILNLIFEIQDVYAAGVLDSGFATAAGLTLSEVRPIRNMASLTATASVTDAEEIENTDGESAVTTLTMEQATTGYTLALEDAERNPYTKRMLAGGHLDANAIYTPKPSNVAAPKFALFCFSRVFDEGSVSLTGQREFSVDIYPSCTAVINNNDKASKDFNHDTFDIVAVDGPAMPAATSLAITSDQYAALVALYA